MIRIKEDISVWKSSVISVDQVDRFKNNQWKNKYKKIPQNVVVGSEFTYFATSNIY